MHFERSNSGQLNISQKLNFSIHFKPRFWCTDAFCGLSKRSKINKLLVSIVFPGFKGCHSYRRSCVFALPSVTSLGLCDLIFEELSRASPGRGFMELWLSLLLNSTCNAIPAIVHRITGEHSGKNYSASDTVTQASPKISGFISPLSKS